MSQRYRTIVADPPWRYAAAATKADASKHYSTMGLGEILGLGGDVRELAEPDAHLWLWTTNAFIEEGYDVVVAQVVADSRSPAPFLEMFSRSARFGWDTHCDESLGGVAA